MNEERFWRIIQRSIDESRGSYSDQVELIANQLQPLSEEELSSFCQIHETLRQRANTWELWGAAYVIAGACSDDEFWHFLGWLICRGHNWFERALTHPDNLADYPEDLKNKIWEFADIPNLASVSFLDKFGYIPNVDFYVGKGEPTGEPWNANDDVFRARWPRLFSKYWKG